jgi:hypothetical protein
MMVGLPLDYPGFASLTLLDDALLLAVPPEGLLAHCEGEAPSGSRRGATISCNWKTAIALRDRAPELRASMSIRAGSAPTAHQSHHHRATGGERAG